MPEKIYKLEVIQQDDGCFWVSNKSMGTEAEEFTISATYKNSKGDEPVSFVVDTSERWIACVTTDGWFQFKLIVVDGGEETVVVIEDVVSFLNSYKCMNDVILDAGCSCDVDLRKWIGYYSKITAAEAAADRCMHSHAQCLIESIGKLCNGC